MSVPILYEGLDKAANRYEAAFIAMWRHAKADSKDPDRIEFSKEDIVFHGMKLREYKLSRFRCDWAMRICPKSDPD